MIALNFVSSLWNRFWTQKPQDVPVLEEEPDSPLSERSVEDLTEQVSPKRPAPLFIPPFTEPAIVILKEFPAAQSPRKIDSPTPPLAAAESPRKIDSPTPPPVASTRPILRVKRSPQASPQKLQTPDARQIQEQTFSELREIFGAELVDRNVTPGKIYTPRELKELFVRLRQESPQGQQTRFFAALQKEFGDEVRFYRPQRDVLLSQAQRTAIASKLRFVDALKKLYDPRAVEALLPKFRAKEISDMGLMAQVGKLHAVLKAQDARIQKWRGDLGINVPLDPNPLARAATQRQEEGAALQILQGAMTGEELDRLLQFVGNDRYLLPMIAHHPQGLVKFFEECASEVPAGPANPARRIEPDAVLLKRLAAAQYLPLNIRLGIANQILERMDQAKQFWTQVNTRFQSPADAIIARCFSRYAQGLFPAGDATIREIGTLVERQKTGTAIADACRPLLRLDQTDGAKHAVDTGLMKAAVSMQLDFDRHLSLREQYDLTASVGSLIETEIGFLKLLQKLDTTQIGLLLPSLDPKEAGIIKGLQEKAAAQGLSFEDAIRVTLEEHGQLLKSKKEKLFALRDKITDDVEQNRSAPQNDAISPMSYKARLILALAEAAKSGDGQKLKDLFEAIGQEISGLGIHDQGRVRLEMLRQQVALDYFRATDDEALVSNLLTALQDEIRALQGQPDAESRVQKLQSLVVALTLELQKIQFDQNQERELSPFMRSFHVVPLGNVVFRRPVYNSDTEKDELRHPDGKWAVVDLRHVPERNRAAIVQLLPPGRIEQILNGKRPYEAVSFDFKNGQLVPRDDKGGAVRIFFEEPKVAFVNHEDRDFGQRSRLIRKSSRTRNEKGERWPKEEHGDYVRVKKEPLKKEETEWSKARMMTAAVDREIVIQGSRMLTEAALSGRVDGLVRDSQHLGEFFDAVSGSDIAKMEGSYGEDPVFNSSVHLFKSQTERLAQADRIRAPLMRADLAVAKKRSREMESLMQMAGVTSFYRAWIVDIIAMQNLAKTNPAFRERFNWFLSQIKTVLPHIFQFLNRFPEEFRQVERIMADITKETGRFPEAAEVARRFGRTPAEIRALLSRSLAGIEKEFKVMKIAFKDLQVAESSARVQERRTQLLMQLFPNDGQLHAQIGNAVGRILNGLTKVTLALEELLKKNVSELSPLHDEVLEAYAGASEEVFQGELLRSQEKQKIMAQLSEEEAIARYFPAPVKQPRGLVVHMPPPPRPTYVEMAEFV